MTMTSLLSITLIIALSSTPRFFTEGFTPSIIPTTTFKSLPTHQLPHHHSSFSSSTSLSFHHLTTPPKKQRLSPLFLAWGPEPTWSTAKVESITPASSNSVSVTLTVSPDVAEGFTTPGQYIQMKPVGDDDTKPLFLAISSPPPSTDDSFEFLIKKTDNNEWITTADPSSVAISQVMGQGFPLAENLDSLKYDFPTQNIILVGMGSGIAPLRSALASSHLNLSAGRSCRLYYGCRNRSEMAFQDEFAAWEAMGVEVVPVLSQEEGDDWGGRTGYVQTALEEDGVPIPRNSGALMCGSKGMCEAVRDVLMRSGVFEGRIMTNF